jgi:murein DD-endopeptidase MepM/ murein hydrolase activator NlpD
MLSVVNEAYTTSQVGALGLLLSADSDEDLVQGVTVLQQFGQAQGDAVQAAERSRERLQEATVAVAAAEQTAQDRVAASQVALATATDAREQVLTDGRTARSLLENSMLADEALRDSAANGYRGALAFPLAEGTAFVDQHNFGYRSKHWATVHTGDDFSTPCGTPVLAVNDGTVLVRTDQVWSGPWLVMVSSGPGELTTWYAHMQALTVVAGQEVHAGDQIGVVGQQGNATGCHLHLEVHPTGGSIYQDDIDPSAWLETVGVYPGA